MLVGELLVGGDEQLVAVLLCPVQQFAIAEGGPSHLESSVYGVFIEKKPERDGRALVKQDLQRLAASASDCISKASTATTSARSTPGNQSRNCWTVAPSLRFSKRAETGTRVPANTHAPLAFSGSRSTAGHVVQSAIVSPSWSVRRTGGWVKRVGPFDGLRANGLLNLTPLDSGFRRNDARGGLGARGVGWRRGRFPPSRERRGGGRGRRGGGSG